MKLISLKGDYAFKELSDMWEVHVVKLRKKLQGTEAVDDWIRLLNAETEEDLEMLKKWHKLAAWAQSIEEFEGQMSAGQGKQM